MLKTLAFALCLALPAAAVERPAKRYTIEQFMAVTKVAGMGFSHDDKHVLYSSNKTGIFNVYRVPVEGGEATQLTTSTGDSTYLVACFPKDGRFLFRRDAGGNERHHLFVQDPDGKQRELTPGKDVRASFLRFTPDGAAFYYQTNERDSRYMDIYRMDAKTYEREKVYEDTTGLQVGAISDDGRWIAFNKPKTTVDSDIILHDTQDGSEKLITPHEKPSTHDPATFDRASAWLYYLTNEKDEFTELRRYNLKSGAHEDVLKKSWDITTAAFSKKGSYRVTATNEDARTVIEVVKAADGQPVALPKLPQGDVTGLRISDSEEWIGFALNDDRSPSNLYVHKLGTDKVTKLTDTMPPGIDREDLVEAEIIRFKSFDGLAIPCLLYKPLDASAAKKAPAIVEVHGGPGGQSRKGYSSFIQYLVNHGYCVLSINNRGSSGYGRTFFAADDRKHGHEPLDDCVSAKKYLAGLPYIAGDRVAIMGGSYGGYMTLAALAFRPDEFAAGVDIFGVSNWIRTLQSIPKWWEAQRQALYAEIGHPTNDQAELKAISPLFHADKIKKPLCVIQGANDPRVIKPESDDIVAAAKKNGAPVEYIVFPDEGHGFQKRKNEQTAYAKILEFLDRHTKPAK